MRIYCFWTPWHCWCCWTSWWLLLWVLGGGHALKDWSCLPNGQHSGLFWSLTLVISSDWAPAMFILIPIQSLADAADGNLLNAFPSRWPRSCGTWASRTTTWRCWRATWPACASASSAAAPSGATSTRRASTSSATSPQRSRCRPGARTASQTSCSRRSRRR